METKRATKRYYTQTTNTQHTNSRKWGDYLYCQWFLYHKKTLFYKKKLSKYQKQTIHQTRKCDIKNVFFWVLLRTISFHEYCF